MMIAKLVVSSFTIAILVFGISSFVLSQSAFAVGIKEEGVKKSGTVGHKTVGEISKATKEQADATKGFGAMLPTTSPLQQVQNGISPHDVKCKAELRLVLKATDGSPACVNIFTKDILVQRGWVASEGFGAVLPQPDSENHSSSRKNVKP